MNQYIDFSTHSGLWSYNIGLSIPGSVVRSLLVASGGGKQWGAGSLFWFITQHHSNMLFNSVDQKYTFLSSLLKHSVHWTPNGAQDVDLVSFSFNSTSSKVRKWPDFWDVRCPLKTHGMSTVVPHRSCLPSLSFCMYMCVWCLCTYMWAYVYVRGQRLVSGVYLDRSSLDVLKQVLSFEPRVH